MYMYKVPHDLVSDKNGLEEGPKWNATSTPTYICIILYIHVHMYICIMGMMYNVYTCMSTLGHKQLSLHS